MTHLGRVNQHLLSQYTCDIMTTEVLIFLFTFHKLYLKLAPSIKLFAVNKLYFLLLSCKICGWQMFC